MENDTSLTLEFMRRLPALSIRQPWAWYIVRPDLVGVRRNQAIANDHMKPVENRDWSERYPPISFRGQFLIHASKGMTNAEYEAANSFAAFCCGVEPMRESLDRGGIVGIAKVVAVVSDHPSNWFTGPVALMLDEVLPLPFVPCKGMLGFFRPEVSP